MVQRKAYAVPYLSAVFPVLSLFAAMIRTPTLTLPLTVTISPPLAVTVIPTLTLTLTL